MGKAHRALKHYSEVSWLSLVLLGPCFVLHLSQRDDRVKRVSFLYPKLLCAVHVIKLLLHITKK